MWVYSVSQTNWDIIVKSVKLATRRFTSSVRAEIDPNDYKYQQKLVAFTILYIHINPTFDLALAFLILYVLPAATTILMICHIQKTSDQNKLQVFIIIKSTCHHPPKLAPVLRCGSGMDNVLCSDMRLELQRTIGKVFTIIWKAKAKTQYYTVSRRESKWLVSINS